MRADRELAIGQTRIAYEVVASDNARLSRIVIDSEGVRVIVPAGVDAEERAVRFLFAKRRWVYRTSRVAKALPKCDEERFLTGARILFRGRRLKLIVVPSFEESTRVTCQSRFDVIVPRAVWSGEEREPAAGAAVKQWLRQRLKEDGQELGKRFAALLGVAPPSVRILAMKKAWASCGRDKILRLTPELVELPRNVFEYVIAHEVAHLTCRNHSPRFWRVVRRLVPDYLTCRRALDEHDRAHARPAHR